MERRNRNRIILEAYQKSKEGKSISGYSRPVLDAVLDQHLQDFKDKYGEQAYNELMNLIAVLPKQFPISDLLRNTTEIYPSIICRWTANP